MGSMIQAGGSVLAQTITDAQVNAAENVVVYDYIINSKVNAGNNLDIPTHHGYAHGGTLQAGNLIRLPKVGPPEEFAKEEDEVEELPTTTTMLEVGISLASRKQFNTLLESIQNNFNEFEDSLKEILDDGTKLFLIAAIAMVGKCREICRRVAKHSAVSYTHLTLPTKRIV